MKYDNYEVNIIKDDLYNLGLEQHYNRDKEVINKALDYINELEELLVNINRDGERAKKLLREQGYVVRKWTKAMERDAQECEECGYEGDCMSCACSVCLMQ